MGKKLETAPFDKSGPGFLTNVWKRGIVRKEKLEGGGKIALYLKKGKTWVTRGGEKQAVRNEMCIQEKTTGRVVLCQWGRRERREGKGAAIPSGGGGGKGAIELKWYLKTRKKWEGGPVKEGKRELNVRNFEN